MDRATGCEFDCIAEQNAPHFRHFATQISACKIIYQPKPHNEWTENCYTNFSNEFAPCHATPPQLGSRGHILLKLGIGPVRGQENGSGWEGVVFSWCGYFFFFRSRVKIVVKYTGIKEMSTINNKRKHKSSQLQNHFKNHSLTSLAALLFKTSIFRVKMRRQDQETCRVADIFGPQRGGLEVRTGLMGKVYGVWYYNSSHRNNIPRHVEPIHVLFVLWTMFWFISPIKGINWFTGRYVDGLLQLVPIKTLQSLPGKLRGINESFETNLDSTMITRD